MTVRKTREPHDKCGARKRQGSGCCRRPAGWATDHVGQGRCKLHGGATPSKHGRYSTIRREPIRKLIDQYESDPQPLNIFPELAATRALFHDFIDRYDAWREALLAWHQSYQSTLTTAAGGAQIALADGNPAAIQVAITSLISAIQTADCGRPVQILDISDAYRLLSEATKIVERIERIRAADHISRVDFTRMMTEMGRVVDRFVETPEILDKIKDGWLGIRL